jgi:uncharacterized membrane protein YccF (DUF307 family)
MRKKLWNTSLLIPIHPDSLTKLSSENYKEIQHFLLHLLFWVILSRSWDTIVSIVTRLQVERSRVQIPAAVISLYKMSRLRLNSIGSRALSLRAKHLKHEVQHSPPSSAKVMNEWNYNSTPLVCLYNV